MRKEALEKEQKAKQEITRALELGSKKSWKNGYNLLAALTEEKTGKRIITLYVTSAKAKLKEEAFQRFPDRMVNGMPLQVEVHNFEALSL